MTSSLTSSVNALQEKLNELCSTQKEIIREVKTLQLPYSGIDSYRFSDDDKADVIVLCHSIHNRRFAITDVVDSLYDEFIAYCHSIGKIQADIIFLDKPISTNKYTSVHFM